MSNVGLEKLLQLVANDMGLVNEFLLSRVVSDVEIIPELAKHLIASGGKRIRPILTLSIARMCGYTGNLQIKLAAAVECMHTATLLHDDVVDESNLRRGKKTARIIWGNEASVLVGDFLLGQAFKMMVETDSLKCLDVLSDAAARIAEGEVMQLASANVITTTEDAYLEIIEAKTAALFAAASVVGGIISGEEEKNIEALDHFGRSLGLVFQLVDDALDYSGENKLLGKSVGDDFREGKVTLPVILAYNKGNDEEKSFWNKVIVEGEANDKNLEIAMELIDKHGAILATIEKARYYGAIAKDSIMGFPVNPYRDALCNAVDFCMERKF